METPRKFIIAELSIRKLGSSVLIIGLFEFTRPFLWVKCRDIYKKGRVNPNSRIIRTDEDSSLRIESSEIINLRGVSTKLNKYIVFTMQTYKTLNIQLVLPIVLYYI